MPEISLQYSCGCVDVWEVSALNDEPEIVQSEHPCVSDSCGSCTAYGRPCATREAMVAADTPVQFAEVQPRRYVRMKPR